MSDGDDFFIGWRDKPPARDRRFLLAASLGLVAAGIGAGAFMASAERSARYGAWDQSAERTWTGLLLDAPYTLLRTADIDGRPRTAYLAAGGKSVIHAPANLYGRAVSLRGSLIARGDNAMIAISDPGAIALQRNADLAGLSDWPETPRGEVLLTGEVLDAKCWFGAMRPGFGLTHKACAALCARGGLPLAFCSGDVCSQGGAAPLFLDEHGHAHGRAILPFVADRIAVRGRMVQVGDVTQLRVAIADIQRT